MGWVKRMLAAAVLTAACTAQAQTTDPTPSSAEPAANSPVEAPSTIIIPAGTTVVLEFVETLSSRTSLTGQVVGLRLVEPIIINGQTVAAAGAVGGGEVIDASRSGMGGRQGKLIVSGRYVEIAGQRARIRGLQVIVAGEDNSREAVNTVILVPYVGWMGGFIQGGEIEIPAGTRAGARLAAEVVVPLSALPQTTNIADPVAEQVQPPVEQVSGTEERQ